MASIDGVIAGLTRSRDSVAQALSAAAQAADLVREVQDQMAAPGVREMTVAISVYHQRGQQPAKATSVTELDDILDRIHTDPTRRDAPPLVEMVMASTDRTLDIGLGRGEYSVLVWHDDDADEVLSSKGDLDPGPDAAFDFGGTWTHIADRSAIPVELARRAAREFAETGLRPACVDWQLPAYTP